MISFVGRVLSTSLEVMNFQTNEPQLLNQVGEQYTPCTLIWVQGAPPHLLRSEDYWYSGHVKWQDFELVFVPLEAKYLLH